MRFAPFFPLLISICSSFPRLKTNLTAESFHLWANEDGAFPGGVFPASFPPTTEHLARELVSCWGNAE